MITLFNIYEGQKLGSNQGNRPRFNPAIHLLLNLFGAPFDKISQLLPFKQILGQQRQIEHLPDRLCLLLFTGLNQQPSNNRMV